MTSTSHVPGVVSPEELEELRQEVRELHKLLRNPVALAKALEDLLREQGLDRIVERPA